MYNIKYFLDKMLQHPDGTSSSSHNNQPVENTLIIVSPTPVGPEEKAKQQSGSHKKFGIHTLEASDILQRKKERVFDILVKFQYELDKINPGDDGVTEDELNGFKGEVKSLNRKAIQAQAAPEYDGIRRELEAKQKLLADIRQQRTENVTLLIKRIKKVKELNRNLFFLKERFLNEEEKKSLHDKDEDSTELLKFEVDVLELKKKMGEFHLLKKKKKVKECKEEMAQLNMRVYKFSCSQHKQITDQISHEHSKMIMDFDMADK